MTGRTVTIYCLTCEAGVTLPIHTVRVTVWDTGEAHYALNCPFCGAVIARMSGCVTLTDDLIDGGADTRWIEDEFEQAK